MRAAILAPARLVLLVANRPLLAVADDGDAVRLDALGDEVIHRRLCATLAERQVVLVGAALIAVSFDKYEVLGVRLQPGGVGIEGLRVLGPDVVLVELEEDVLQSGDGGELFQ